jgi:hypothetical protein
MPRTLFPKQRNKPPFNRLYYPIKKLLLKIPLLRSRGNRDLQMNFEQQLKALIYFHLQEYKSGRHLLQVLEEDNFARKVIAPPKGIKKSSFFEAINTRGLEQLAYVFEELQAQAVEILPTEHADLGELVAIDGSIIDAVLSMHWADFKNGKKKAKTHLGFDLNHSIPYNIFLTGCMSDERPFVSEILSPGQTGVLDRYYQRHKCFDLWQEEEIYFVCRIRDNTIKKCIRINEVKQGIVFYDAVVILGSRARMSEKEIRVVGYKARGKKYWVATNRYDLSAEQVAAIYKLRWNIENFFGWWKQHLKVYHVLARTKYGLMAQILGGLITYLLLALYCRQYYNEKVSIKRVRQLRIEIQNDPRGLDNVLDKPDYFTIREGPFSAKT